MCAIKPKHKKRFILDVYTSDPKLTKREFEQLAVQEAVETELQMNTANPRLRWHLKESTDEAD
ncbi:MAG TPA: hypothetical protein VFQ43_14520 [Nitrososphaera sp.]|nr:hypothetical protein [Nitrososphaera sp.]